ncbi:hypothetical protein CEXT_201211, partial [Caerostris extrusa]
PHSSFFRTLDRALLHRFWIPEPAQKRGFGHDDHETHCACCQKLLPAIASHDHLNKVPKPIIKNTPTLKSYLNRG